MGGKGIRPNAKRISMEHHFGIQLCVQFQSPMCLLKLDSRNLKYFIQQMFLVQRVITALICRSHIRSYSYYGYLVSLWPFPVFRKWQAKSECSQVVLVVKNPLASTGDMREVGSNPGSGRSLGEGHGSPLQCSCLENPMDRGTWQATVHRVTKSGLQPK